MALRWINKSPYATNNGNPTTVPAVRGVTNLLIKASPE